MPFDAELDQLTRDTHDTFGMAAWRAACDQARFAVPYYDDCPGDVFPGESWQAAFLAALKTELRRLLQPQ